MSGLSSEDHEDFASRGVELALAKRPPPPNLGAYAVKCAVNEAIRAKRRRLLLAGRECDVGCPAAEDLPFELAAAPDLQAARGALVSFLAARCAQVAAATRAKLSLLRDECIHHVYSLIDDNGRFRAEETRAGAAKFVQRRIEKAFPGARRRQPKGAGGRPLKPVEDDLEGNRELVARINARRAKRSHAVRFVNSMLREYGFVGKDELNRIDRDRAAQRKVIFESRLDILWRAAVEEKIATAGENEDL